MLDLDHFQLEALWPVGSKTPKSLTPLSCQTGSSTTFGSKQAVGRLKLELLVVAANDEQKCLLAV